MYQKHFVNIPRYVITIGVPQQIKLELRLGTFRRLYQEAIGHSIQRFEAL